MKSDTGEQQLFPRRYGDYLLLARLARGGSGEVFLARVGAASSARYVVIKTLKEELLDDSESVRRFCDEARVLVRLEHRNICRVLDVGRTEDRFYIAMEHIPGRDLGKVLERLTACGERMPREVALYVMCELLDALDHAHRKADQITGQPLNIVHRDVSPQNVMLTYDGGVKLIDFGIAASSLKNVRTQPRVVLGKLAYMSPEQARGEAAAPDSDVFASAIMLYEMLTSRRFYSVRDPAAIREALRNGVAPEGMQSLPPALSQTMLRALEVDRSRRLSSAAALYAALEDYQQEHQLQAGAGDVRALLDRLFANERKDEQQHLRALDAVTAPTPLAHGEETMRIAIADDLAALSDISGSLTMPRGTVTEATRTHAGIPDASPLDDTRRPATRATSRNAAIAAAVALAAVASAVLAATVISGDGADADTPPAPSTNAAVAAATPTATPPVAIPVEAAPAARLVVVAEEPAKPAPRPRGNRRPATGDARGARDVRPARDEPAEPPPAPRFLRDKARYLEERCADRACAARLRGRIGAIGGMSEQEARAFRGAVDACLATCRASP